MKKFLVFGLIFSISISTFAAKIRVGSSPALSSAGIYLAERFGYFKAQGLDVEISDFANSGSSMTLLLAKGSLDVGAGNLTSGLFNAILKGEKFKIVADKGHVEKGREYMQLVVRKDHLDSKRFKELKDLKGFKIGVTALDGVSQQIIIDRFLKKNGLSESDIEYVKMSYAEMNIALKNKNIDAAIQLEPFLSKSLDEVAVVKVASSYEVHPNQQSAALFYSPDFIKNKDAALKFMIAYLKGVQTYNDAISGKNLEAVKVLKEVFKIDDKQWNKMIQVGLHEDGHLNRAELMEDIKWYKEKKFIASLPSESDLIDESFSSQAAKLIKK